MKMSLSAKIIIFFFMLFAICAGFAIYAAFMFAKIAITITTIIFGSLIIALFAVFVFILQKHMLFVLSQLSEVISALIDMRENEVFSVLNDDMLSKLQSQVIKLSGILKGQNTRLKNERNEIKSLISDISHQLKTPLANLRVYCDLLLDANLLPVQRKEFTRNMQGQLEKLSFLLESMIKMSRLESGIIQLSPEPGSLNETCLSAIRQIYQKAQAKNIQISFESGQDIQLKHDRNWTAEAIVNILDNAVKYTESNRNVTISIAKYEFFAMISIADTGSGLEEAEINKIFRRFYRGENARKQEGVGIGLYLSREIIQKQGGYIKVQSKKNKGSTFSLFLPLN